MFSEGSGDGRAELSDIRLNRTMSLVAQDSILGLPKESKSIRIIQDEDSGRHIFSHLV